MKTPEETAIEILELLNFDHTRCQDWVKGIAEIIEERDLEEPNGTTLLKRALKTAKACNGTASNA
jgi:hypothetical protein